MTTNTAGVLASAQAIYRDEGLELPVLPAALKGELRSVGVAAFATRPIEGSLYEFERFVGELAIGDPRPYCAFGFAGHGLASHAVHLYTVTDRLAFLLQLRWSGAFDDGEAVRKRYSGLLKTARTLDWATGEAVRVGRFPAGRRLVVAQSSFHGSRWGWVARPGTGEPQWRRSRDMAPVEAAVELRRLAEGKAPAPA